MRSVASAARCAPANLYLHRQRLLVPCTPRLRRACTVASACSTLTQLHLQATHSFLACAHVAPAHAHAPAGVRAGTLIARVTVSGVDGSVTGVAWLADTLVEVPNHDRSAAEAWLEGRVLPRLRALVQHEVRDSLLATTFPVPPRGRDGAAPPANSFITLPIVFE